MYELREAARGGDDQTPDVKLLLVGHGERRWLLNELLPQLDELETPGLVGDAERPAALASLESMWHDAQVRAQETERAFVLVAGSHVEDPELRRSAERFHGQVRSLREIIGHRVEALTHPASAA
jgi:hypothetical protein